MIYWSMYDKELFLDFIQEELEDEPLQFKWLMTRAKNKKLKSQIYSKFLMLQTIRNSKDMKIMIWLGAHLKENLFMFLDFGFSFRN